MLLFRVLLSEKIRMNSSLALSVLTFQCLGNQVCLSPGCMIKVIYLPSPPSLMLVTHLLSFHLHHNATD